VSEYYSCQRQKIHCYLGIYDWIPTTAPLCLSLSTSLCLPTFIDGVCILRSRLPVCEESKSSVNVNSWHFFQIGLFDMSAEAMSDASPLVIGPRTFVPPG
jgi:hypothetical protein